MLQFFADELSRLMTLETGKALRTESQVEAKVFSNTFRFYGGLAEHFRNLLISKDERTVQLLEAADDIKDKYFKQANLVNETFLLNALNVINQCDIEYKTAKNKRLHVELALLKVCFLNTQIESSLSILLGEKKN